MSNQMNPWLASIYGTDGADDIEKTAQAHLLHKLAAENNIDLSQLSPEELEQLQAELAAEGYDVGGQEGGPQMQGQPGQGFAPQQPQPGMHPMMQQAFAPAAQPQMPQGMNPQQFAPQQGGADVASLQKEAQAKFEEADLLGRVMAHAYTDELEKIASHQKTAGRFDAAKGAAGRFRNGAVSAGHKAVGHVKRNKGAYGAAAAGAAGFGVGRASKKTKEASAFEKMAEEHAAEILSATGFDPASGQDLYAQQAMQQDPNQGYQQPQQGYGQQGQQAWEQQGQGQPDQQFTEALDNRALELLAENGYDVNEILARIQQQQGQA